MKHHSLNHYILLSETFAETSSGDGDQGSVKSVHWGRNVAYSPPADIPGRKKISPVTATDELAASSSEEIVVDRDVRVPFVVARPGAMPEGVMEDRFDSSDDYS